MTCPVALYTATEESGDVHFHLINPKTNNRVKMVATDPDTGPIERSELEKGYEVSKGKYVLVTDDELRAVKLESTKTIDIERFVPAADIDRVYWDHPYFLAPDGDMADEAFGVIREAMSRSKQIAIGRVVLSTRERILAIEPRDRGMLAYSLRSEDDVRKPDEIFKSIKNAKPEPEMIQIAETIIRQKEGPFDPGQFADRYEKALKKLIADKQKGRESIPIEEPAATNVVDLMSALKASLGGKSGHRPKASKTKPGARVPRSARKKASWW